MKDRWTGPKGARKRQARLSACCSPPCPDAEVPHQGAGALIGCKSSRPYYDAPKLQPPLW